jgi:hypothetical protein
MRPLKANLRAGENPAEVTTRNHAKSAGVTVGDIEMDTKGE